MRFTFISTMSGLPWGGSEELWSQAASRFKSEGHQVSASVHYWEKSAPAIDILQSLGIVVHARRPIFPNRAQRVLAKLLRRPLGDLTGKAEWAWLSQSKPDLVCISNGATMCGLSWMLQCQSAGIPYVTISQCNFEGWWPTDEHVTQILPAFRSARKCFFVSQRNRELCDRQIGETLHNSQVVRNPFKVRYDVDFPWVVGSSPLKLACVARLEPAAKGQDILLQVLAKKKWGQRNLKVQFYGQGPCENSLRKLAANLCPGQVEFKGHVANVEEIWADNHGLILPSRYEGLPLAVVEAMLCSRMVIVSDVAGNAEFVEHGKSGFIAPAPTVDFLDAALEVAWQSRDSWRDMGMAARKSVVQFVPRDPLKEFCSQLEALAKGEMLKTES